MMDKIGLTKGINNLNTCLTRDKLYNKCLPYYMKQILYNDNSKSTSAKRKRKTQIMLISRKDTLWQSSNASQISEWD